MRGNSHVRFLGGLSGRPLQAYPVRHYALGDSTMSTGEFWHVIWTTYGCWKPDDHRGDWTSLGDFYERLVAEFPGVRFSRALPKVWKSTRFLKDHVRLNHRARAQVGSDIRQLSAAGGDQVAGSTPVIGIAVEPTCVQLVVSCDAATSSQRVGRLKSRTATLLSFVPETGAGGKSTWGKGFWYACFMTREPSVALSRLWVLPPEELDTEVPDKQCSVEFHLFTLLFRFRSLLPA